MKTPKKDNETQSQNACDVASERRGFLKALGLGFLSLPFLLKAAEVFAIDPKKLPKGAKALDPNAPMAKALGYVHDVKDVNVARFKKFKAGQNCGNCLQYVDKGGGWGECKIIKGGLVAEIGWCNSYLPMKKA